MGVSTDAIIAFGIDLGEDEPDLDDDLMESLDEWGSDGPIMIVHHCAGDFPMYFLAIRGTKQRASRGYPKKLDALGTIDPQPLIDFCAEHNIEIEAEEIGWHLFSYWS